MLVTEKTPGTVFAASSAISESVLFATAPFGRGPGAFTGVRLAASVAQGLAFGAELGVVPVSDLAAVAQRAGELRPDAERLLAVNDARMQEVYWAEFTRAGCVEAGGPERVSAASEVTLPRSGAWVAAGRGLRAAPALAERCQRAGAVVLDDLLPRASEILALARPSVASGQLLPPERALPVYVRDRVVAPVLS